LGDGAANQKKREETCNNDFQHLFLLRPDCKSEHYNSIPTALFQWSFLNLWLVPFAPKEASTGRGVLS